ncbi:MAG: hypothetical protein IT461_17140 [Planctomycetes bacterium]|nr:hypothetical protein [Planctomycetota bacterium]
MEILGVVLASAAIIVSIALHLWNRRDLRLQREDDQRGFGELKGEVTKIRAAANEANLVAVEALDEARKAHSQRAELTDQQLSQTLLPRIAELEKLGAEACYQIGILDSGNFQKHRPMSIRGQQEVVMAVRQIRERLLAGKLSTREADAELRTAGEKYQALMVYLKENKL